MAGFSVEITGDIKEVTSLEKTTTTRINQYASALADELLKEVKQEIIDTDTIASRKLFHSIAIEVISQFGTGIEVAVGSPLDYAEYAESGRGAGTQPPREVIEQWMIDKGVTSPYGLRRGSFLIARKIGAEGTDGKHFFENALNTVQGRFPSIASRIFS